MTQADIERRQTIERRIVERIVDDALALGYTVSVDDGDGDHVGNILAYAIARSTDKAAILAALFAMDEDVLIVHLPRAPGELMKTYIGRVQLVYGNDGHDVIADYSSNPRMEAVLAGAEKLADEIAEQEA